jgi:hypothetical protein
MVEWASLLVAALSSLCHYVFPLDFLQYKGGLRLVPRVASTDRPRVGSGPGVVSRGRWG